MCTLALFVRVFPGCPLLVAANRDERYERPTKPPHLWDTQPAILAGRDLSAGGTWLGVNEQGLVVGILNRKGGTTPTPNFRSRGLFCLDLLRHKRVSDARAFISEHRERYAPFTAVFADSQEAWLVFNSTDQIETAPLPRGLHVFSTSGLHDEQTEKNQHAYQVFSATITDVNRTPEFPSCVSVLAEALRDHELGHFTGDPKDAICVHSDLSGTVSSTIVALFAAPRHFEMVYCPGPPCQNSFGTTLSLDVS
jgi:uncharacterized protein with NRDE domain